MQQLKSFFCGHVAFSKQIKVRYNLKTKGQLIPAIFLALNLPKSKRDFLKDLASKMVQIKKNKDTFL